MVQRIQTQKKYLARSCSIQYPVTKTAFKAFSLILVLCSCASLELQNYKKKKPITYQEIKQKVLDQKFFSKGIQYLKKKNYKKALEFFKNEESLQKDKTLTQAKINSAIVYYRIGQYDSALSKLREITDEFPLQGYLKSLYFRWKILTTHKKDSDVFEEKLHILDQIISYETILEKKEIAKKRAKSIIQNLSVNEISSLDESREWLFLNKWILFIVAQNFIKEKDFEKALDYFQKLLIHTQDDSVLEKRVHQYIQAIKTRTKAYPQRIGAILPLTGSYKRIGEKCIKGLQLGLGLYDDKPSDIELFIIDSKGHPQSVEENLKNLVLKQKVIGLVGGVVSSVAVKLAQLSQSFMLPSILLSQKSELTKEMPFIFQNSINNKYVIKYLVDYLMDEKDHKNFAVLYPNDHFGVEQSNLFWDYVASKGGNIKGAQTYKEGATDFNDTIKRLAGLYYIEDRDEEYREHLKNWFSKKRNYRSNKQLRSLLPPVLNFTVLFIPDSIKSLHNIAPYLALHDIEEITLAGTGIWNSNQILRSKTKQLEHVVFADALITKHPQFKKSDFYKQFQNVFGYAPSLFEFLSYQSALALRQAISNGSRSREELQRNLAQIKTLGSPIGEIKISENREFIYPITNFGIKDKEIVSLNP